jgi:hypothetical protein
MQSAERTELKHFLYHPIFIGTFGWGDVGLKPRDVAALGIPEPFRGGVWEGEVD